KHAALALGERVEDIDDLFAEEGERRHVVRILGGLVLDEVTKAVSSPSPTGDWSEMGCCAIFMICCTRSTGRFISSATSSGVGSWPYSCRSCFCTCITLFSVSIMWTGMRMVRA